MGAGGIIHQRARLLVDTASDPSFYDSLPGHCKRKVDDIKAKAELDRTEQDVMTLAAIVNVAVHC